MWRGGRSVTLTDFTEHGIAARTGSQGQPAYVCVAQHHDLFCLFLEIISAVFLPPAPPRCCALDALVVRYVRMVDMSGA